VGGLSHYIQRRKTWILNVEHQRAKEVLTMGTPIIYIDEAWWLTSRSRGD